MAETRHVQLVVSILFTLFAVGESEYCTTSQWYNSYTHRYEDNTEYCSYGCCGYYPNEYCCYDDDYDDYDATWVIWVIVGGVLGAVVFISVVIALICVCLKKQGYQGRVVQPVPYQTANPTFSTTTVAYSGTSGQYPAHHAGPAQPGPSVAYHPPPAPPVYSEPPKY